jgi:hypothetical protein
MKKVLDAQKNLANDPQALAQYQNERKAFVLRVKKVGLAHYRPEEVDLHYNTHLII